MTMVHTIRRALEDSARTHDAFRRDESNLRLIARFAETLIEVIEKDGRLFACGNGGSLCDAMHFAQEWTGRFRRTRAAIPAMALSDPATQSCIANDFGWEDVFARQLEAHARSGDLLLALSTSGESTNVRRAVFTARKLGVASIGLLGRGGGKLASEVDLPILVPHATTSDRIQEVHIQVIHAVIEAVERQLFPEIYVDPQTDPDITPN